MFMKIRQLVYMYHTKHSKGGYMSITVGYIPNNNDNVKEEKKVIAPIIDTKE